MEIDENGVVNPLRLPSPIRDFGRSLADLPALGRLFLVLAAVDIGIGVATSHELSLWAIARGLPILYPVAVLWPRRGTGGPRPDALRGTILVALGSLAITVLSLANVAVVVGTDVDENDYLTIVSAAGVIVSLLSAAGWWLVARAVAGLRPPRSVGFGVAGAIVALVSLGTAVVFLGLVTTAGGEVDVLASVVYGAASLLSAGVAAYVCWIFVSRAGLPPRIATWSAAAGALTAAIGSVPALIIGLLVVLIRSDPLIASQGVGLTVASIAGLLTPLLYNAAFATGLVDREVSQEPPAAGTVPGPALA